ncbi:hypothetical protein Hanom_Chr01g00084391 [Helianthus anomalus]
MWKNKPLDKSCKTGQTSGANMAFYSLKIIPSYSVKHTWRCADRRSAPQKLQSIKQASANFKIIIKTTTVKLIIKHCILTTN